MDVHRHLLVPVARSAAVAALGVLPLLVVSFASAATTTSTTGTAAPATTTTASATTTTASATTMTVPATTRTSQQPTGTTTTRPDASTDPCLQRGTTTSTSTRVTSTTGTTRTTTTTPTSTGGSPTATTSPGAGLTVGTPSLVSSTLSGGSVRDSAESPAVSADGRYVAFVSGAADLVANDTNGNRDVFVRDTVTGSTVRASVDSEGGQQNGYAGSADLSADGRYVAFTSVATNLVPGDTNRCRDVFVHDLVTGATERVSIGADGAEGNGHADNPSISDDGSRVSFLSYATNLVDADSNATADVFVRDRTAATTTRVSLSSSGAPADRGSVAPTISGDGSTVAFISAATNLVPGDTNRWSDVFVRDLAGGVTSLESVGMDGEPATGASWQPVLDRDGRHLAFASDAQNLVPGDTRISTDVFVRDRATGTTSRVSMSSSGAESSEEHGMATQSWEPSISADGRLVAFTSDSANFALDDINAASDVFVRDTVAGSTTIASVNAAGFPGDGRSTTPRLSADGRHLVYVSSSTDLVPEDTSSYQDVFTTTLSQGSAPTSTSPITSPGPVRRLSVGLGGAEPDSFSWVPEISADGRTAAFASQASNLVAGDTSTIDVFTADSRTGGLALASVGPAGARADDESIQSSLSANGRLLEFTSRATNLVPGDTNGVEDVFLRDLRRGTVRRISVGQGGGEGNGRSYGVRDSVSVDGRYVLFVSLASNLVPGDTNGAEDVFLRDLATGRTTRVSLGSDGTEAEGASRSAALSGNGRYVAFTSTAANLVEGDTNGAEDVFLRDLATGRTTRVSLGVGGAQGNARSSVPVISADGRHVAFESIATNLAATDTNRTSDVFVHDTRTGATVQASVSSAEVGGRGYSSEAAISADGRYVVFRSDAANLVAADSDLAADVFLRDLVRGETRRLSVGLDGKEADGPSESPAISADGRTVVFSSSATNLVRQDTNGWTDVFLIRLRP